MKEELAIAGVGLLLFVVGTAGLFYVLSNTPDEVCRQAGFRQARKWEGHIYCSYPIAPPPPDWVKVR